MAVRRIWDVTPITGAPLGYERLAIPSGLFANFSPPDGTTRLWFKVVNRAGTVINMRDDGSFPSASEGMPLEAGDSVVYDAQIKQWTDLLFYRDATNTAANPELRALYYGD